jgi:catechol 2,3-dioxygenase-like lactoylglutathione lyase family enzyme
METALTTGAGAAAEPAPLAESGGVPLLHGIEAVTHCVERLDVAEAAWSGVPGYVTVERGEIDADLCAAWNAPAARGLRWCVMRPASGESCYLRFIETGGRGHAPPATWGWTATELLVTDTDDLARRLEGSGFRRLGGPADLYPRAKAPRAMQVIGPSGELVYFTRLLPGGSRYGLKQARSYVDRPFIVTVGGPSSAALHAFYGGALGLRIMDRTPFSNRLLAALCGAPPDTLFPTAVARIPGRRFLVEMDEFPPGVGARVREPGELPPGMSMVSFSVASLDGLPGLALRAAARTLAPAPYGGRRACVVEGPVGEWLELIEERAGDR